MAPLPGRILVKHPGGCARSGGRVVEGARLESEYTAKPYRGFESLPLRHSSARNAAAPRGLPFGFFRVPAAARPRASSQAQNPMLGRLRNQVIGKACKSGLG